MPTCFRCEKKTYPSDLMTVHWGGTSGSKKAEHCISKNFYQSDGVTSKWRRFTQKAIKQGGVDVNWWRSKFGKGERLRVGDHDVYNPKRRLRNTRYSWEPEPKGWTQADLRDKALEVLDSVLQQIEKRKVSPLQYTTGKRSRDVAAASDEQEAKLEDMSDEVLADEEGKLERKIAVDEAKLHAEKQRLESIRRLRQERSEVEEVQPAKRPRRA